MAAGRADGGTPGGSWKWTAFTIVGLALWIGGTVVAGARSDTPTDGTATRHAFVIGGAIFFGLMFAGAAWSIRNSKRRTGSRLYDRLAIDPMAGDTLRKATGGLYRIGYVYVAFGALVTGLGLAAIGVDDEQRTRQLMMVMVALVVVWAVFAVFALRRAFTAGDSVMTPLGLRLTGTPSFHYSAISDHSWMTGAMSYAGTRHGRNVSITQHPKHAATVVAGVVGDVRPPTTPAQMTKLTGEPIGMWRGVSVDVEDGAVIVQRSRNGAGGWFLHDLLLAERVAASD